MKTLSRLFALTSVSLFTALIPAAHAAPASPEGEWDFVMAGKQRGVALLTFDSNYRLFGTEIFRPAPPKGSSSASGDARNPLGTPASRDGASTSTGTPGTGGGTNFYGSADLEGVWTYDSGGRIIGAINELYSTLELVTRSYTNEIILTNGIVTNEVITVTAPEYVPHTNGISFRGTLGRTGKLMMNFYTPRGLSTFTGVRMAELPDYSANYYGIANKTRPVVEFFSIVPNGLASMGYHIYGGTGPGYTFEGTMFISKQKQVAIYAETDYGDITVATGAYKTNRFTGPNAITGDLRGIADTRNNFLYKLAPRP